MAPAHRLAVALSDQGEPADPHSQWNGSDWRLDVQVIRLPRCGLVQWAICGAPHNANYNRDGYYSVFFERDADKVVFLDQTLRWPCYGDPTYTFCDVERAVQRRLRAANVIEVFRMREADATRKRELDILARLQAKYGANREPPSSSPQTSPPQADLFAT